MSENTTAGGRAVRKHRRSGRLLPVAFSVMALVAAPLADSSGLFGGGRADADEASEQDFINQHAWGTYSWSAPIEGYAEIPLGLPTGYPMADVRLGTPAPKCEARAAGHWMSYEVEEGVIPGNVPGNDPGPGESSSYRHPTLARSANPPYVSQYGEAPKSSKVAPTGDQAGPMFRSECQTPLHGEAYARHFGVDAGDIKVGYAQAFSKQHLDAKSKLVKADHIAHLSDIDLGGVKIQHIGTFLRVELPPDADAPKVTYKISLNGISQTGANGEGDDAVWAGHGGITLSGQHVPGDELVKQFNEQVKANEKSFEAIGRYGLTIMAPRFDKDACWGRVKGTSCPGWHLVEAPVLDAGFGPAARKKDIGQYQALRLGSTRFLGAFSATGE